MEQDILLRKKEEIAQDYEIHKQLMQEAKGKLDLLNEILDELEKDDQDEETPQI